MIVTAYIGFGSNLGDRLGLFHAALEALDNLPATRIKSRSSVYETEPEGITDNGSNFLNAVIGLETKLDAQELMAMMRTIELRLGKSPHHRSDMSRAIDLDLLLYGDENRRVGDLILPHPRMHQRAFVMVPLVEIAPDVQHPVFECQMSALLRRLPPEHLKRVVQFEHVSYSKA